MSEENNNPNFESKLKTLTEIPDRSKYMFEHREQILINFEKYIASKLITYKDICYMFLHSIRDYGISGDTTTQIVLQMLKLQNKEERKIFIRMIS